MSDGRTASRASHPPSNEISFVLGDSEFRFPKKMNKYKSFAPILSGVEKIIDFIENAASGQTLNTNNTRQRIGECLKEVTDAVYQLFTEYTQLKSELELKNGQEAIRTQNGELQTGLEALRKDFEDARMNLEQQNLKLETVEEFSTGLLGESEKQALEITKLKSVLDVELSQREKSEIFSRLKVKDEYMESMWSPGFNKMDLLSSDVKSHFERRINDLEMAKDRELSKLSKEASLMKQEKPANYEKLMSKLDLAYANTCSILEILNK